MKKNPNGWTPERRARQSQKIREWKPWQQSTGPRTLKGKQKTSQNAWDHGFRSKDMVEINDFLRRQRNYINALKTRHRAENMLD
jgi:hypothetical protein